MRPAVLTALLLVLAGCATPLAKLKEINPPANDFHSSLASEYLAYADSESEQGRKLVAEYYANKGLKALKGKDVPPEQPAGALPDWQRDELAAARARLMQLRSEDMKRVAPQKLARAQLLFDCWQRQLSLHLSEENAPCAGEFRAGLTELQEVAESFEYGKVVSYTIGFSSHGSRLDHEAQATIDEIAQQGKNAKAYIVEIAIHSGIGSHQRRLSEKRLAAIRQALARAGVSAAHVQMKQEEDYGKVYLSCDVTEENLDDVQLTLKIRKNDKE